MIVFDQLRRNDPHLRAVTLGTLTGLAVLFVGLWWVQVLSHRHYSESQKNQSFRTVRIPAVRGKILDKHGVALAENQPSYNVILYLDELREQFRQEWARSQPRHQIPDESWWRSLLSRVGFKSSKPPRMKSVPVRMSASQQRALQAQARFRVASNAVQQVALAVGQPIPFDFDNFMRHYTNQLALPMPIIRNLNDNQVARLLEGGRSPRGIDLEVQPMRVYPGGPLAAHVLGYLMPDISSVEGELSYFSYRLPDYRGHVGIERQFDAELRGKAGVKNVLVNSLGYRQSETIWNEAEPGKNVFLTLHAELQAVTETALRSTMNNARGAAVVMDPNTGNILAMASSPPFDPNWFIPRISTENWHWMSDTNLKPQINRTMQMNYSPGSVFKIVTGLAALEHGLDPKELYTVHADPARPGRGCIYVGRRKIDDLAAAGDYDFRRAFIHSSNAYFITNGMKAGIEALVTLGRRFHFGERTELIARQEYSGAYPTMADLRKNWFDGDTANLCIGQGKVDMTPLQVAVMIGAVANGGKVLWPRLVDRIEPADRASGEETIYFPARPVRDELGLSARSLQVTRDAMLADVEEGGTGKAAMVPGFRIGGKTGTAEIKVGGRTVDHTTWFASYGPVENPRYVVVVMVESGSSGGGTCAPAVGKIYRRIQEMENGGRAPVASIR